MFRFLNQASITLLREETAYSSAQLQDYATLAHEKKLPLIEYVLRQKYLTRESAKKILQKLLQAPIPCGSCSASLVLEKKTLHFYCPYCSLSPSTLPTQIQSSSPSEESLLAFTESVTQTHSSVSSSALSSERLPQKTHIGKYEILEKIGQGGMGVVYRVFQKELQQQYALKLLTDGEFADPEQLQRFKNEAQIVASLSHPYIVKIQEMDSYNGHWFYCMDLIQGVPLDEWASKKPLKETLEAFLKILQALTYAHQQGIIHRDLKPDNILIDQNHQPKILDFGIAKNRKSNAESLTQTHSILGTPHYLSPEQAQGSKHLQGKSDVFSMGIVLYELLTHQLPFKAETSIATILQIVHQEPIPPRKVKPNLPKDLEVLCLKALEKEPKNRYSMKGFATDLERYLRGEPLLAKSFSLRYFLWRKFVKNRRILIPLACSLLIICSLAILLLLERQNRFRLQIQEKKQELWNYARDQENQSRFSEALVSINQLLELEASSKEALWFRALLLQKMGKTVEAYLELLPLSHDPLFCEKSLFALAQCHLTLQQPLKAFESYRQIRQTQEFKDFEKQWYQTCLLLAEQEASQGNFAQALLYLNEGLAREFLLATEEVLQQKLRDRLFEYEKLQTPDSEKTLLERIEFLEKNPALHSSLAEELRLFLSQNSPFDAKALHEKRADLLFQQKLYSKALEEYQWLTQRYSEEPRYWLRLAESYQALSQEPQARKNFLNAAGAYWKQGETLYSQRKKSPLKTPEALESFRRALKLEFQPEEKILVFLEALKSYGISLATNEFEIEKAIALFEEAQSLLKKIPAPISLACKGDLDSYKSVLSYHLKEYQKALNPKDARDFTLRATLYRSSFNDLPKTLELYNQSLQKDPNDLLSLNNRAGLYIEIGRYEDALKDLKKALERDPTMPEAAFQIYQIYHFLKHKSEIQYWQKKAADLMFKRSLAFLKNEQNPDYLNKAISILPDSEYLKVRVDFYLKRQPSFALEDLKILYQRHPQDPEILYSLAYALHALNLNEAALVYLQQCLTQNPSFASAQTLLNKLSK
jgi:tetratricopeptide (TPR) repeat protein